MRETFICLILLVSASGVLRGQGQMEDFISLKRPDGRHVGSYFKGSRIDFQRVNGQRIDGTVETVRNDSVFIREWQVQTFMTSFGTTRVDTVGSFLHRMHYTEIFRIFPARREGFRYVRNGLVFMIGGAGYALLNVVNGAYFDAPINEDGNLRSLAIAGGVFAGGFILNRIYRGKVKKGKLYKIVYVKMTGK